MIENKKKFIGCYLNEEEYQIIRKKIKASNFDTKSEYFRECLLEKNIYVVDTKPLLGLSYEFNKIGVNVNQLAKKVNENDRIQKKDMIEIKKYINDLQDQIDIFTNIIFTSKEDE